MFEVADTGDPVDVLKRCVKARERLEKTFVTSVLTNSEAACPGVRGNGITSRMFAMPVA